MPIRDLLRADLTEARRARDAERVALIRSLIAAIENAEAVDGTAVGSETEVARRSLSEAQVKSIIRREAHELRHAADEYEQSGRSDEADRLRALARLTDGYASTPNRPARG